MPTIATWPGFAPQGVFRTAHKYIPVAAATTAIHGGSTLLKTPSDANPSYGCGDGNGNGNGKREVLAEASARGTRLDRERSY
jgi:hypothetical protein